MPVTVVTDSASSISTHDLAQLGIVVVPLWITAGGQSHPETEIDLESLYEELRDVDSLPATSQPAPGQFASAFRAAVLAGNDVVAVVISSKLSGTFASAEIAAQTIKDELPHARIALVDSGSNSMQQGFAVLAAADTARSGGDIEACVGAARDSIARSRFLFAPDGLAHLARGGRIGGATALVGQILKIVPILTASEGATAVAGVARSHKRALDRMVATFRADIERCGFSRVVVQAVGRLEEARDWAQHAIEPIVGVGVSVVPIPAAVGIHVGPAIGLAYETQRPLKSS